MASKSLPAVAEKDTQNISRVLPGCPIPSGLGTIDEYLKWNAPALDHQEVLDTVLAGLSMSSQVERFVNGILQDIKLKAEVNFGPTITSISLLPKGCLDFLLSNEPRLLTAEYWYEVLCDPHKTKLAISTSRDGDGFVIMISEL